MIPWAPVPIALTSDLRVRALSVPARLLLHTLYLASHDRATVPVADLTPGQAARAVLGDAHEAAGPELVASGLVTVEPGRWRLALAVEGMASPVAPAAPLVPAQPRAEAHAPTGRSAAQVREARYRFGRRERQWSSVPVGVSWEAWLATPEGVAWSRCDAATPCDASRDALPATPATPQRDGSATGLRRPATPCDASPSDSPSEKETQSSTRDRENTAPARGVASATVRRDGATLRDATPATPSPVAASQPSQPADGIDGAAVEEALYRATKGAIRLSAAPSTQGAAIVARLRAEGVTPSELAVVAEVIAADGGKLMWHWADRPDTVAWLSGPHRAGTDTCDRLAEAIAAARRGGVRALRQGGTGGRPKRLGPAPCSTAADFETDALEGDFGADVEALLGPVPVPVPARAS